MISEEWYNDDDKASESPGDEICEEREVRRCERVRRKRVTAELLRRASNHQQVDSNTALSGQQVSGQAGQDGVACSWQVVTVEQQRVVRRRLDVEEQRQAREAETPTLGSRGFVEEHPATGASQEERLSWQESFEDRTMDEEEQDDEKSSGDDSFIVGDDADSDADYDPAEDVTEYETHWQLSADAEA